MAAQQEWIDDVRRWCFDGGRADPPLCVATSTDDAADERPALAAPRLVSLQAMAVSHALATLQPSLPGA